MKRGEVWWVAFDPAVGAEVRKTRPAIVLSMDWVNDARRTISVVPLTSASRAQPPLLVPVPSAGQGSLAKCDQVRTVDKTRLTERRGVLAAEDLAAVEAATRLVLGL